MDLACERGDCCVNEAYMRQQIEIFFLHDNNFLDDTGKETQMKNKEKSLDY